MYIHMYVIKFGHFLLLICLMSILIIDQLEDPRRVEEKFLPPHTPLSLNFLKCPTLSGTHSPSQLYELMPSSVQSSPKIMNAFLY